MKKVTLSVVLLALLMGLVSTAQALQPGATQGFIGDRVWHDQDGDGKQDKDALGNYTEPGIAGAQVTLYFLSGTTWNQAAQMSTDANGIYGWIVRLGYRWKVEVTLPSDKANWTQTYDWDGLATLNTAEADLPKTIADPDVPTMKHELRVDFGYWYYEVPQAKGSIGDRVWYDADAEGDQDVDELGDEWGEYAEPGINGVTVYLWNAEGYVVDQTVTAFNPLFPNEAGYYLFTEVPQGTYSVSVVPAPQLRQTYDLDGMGPNSLNIVDNIVVSDAPGGKLNHRDVDFGYVMDEEPPGDWMTFTQGGWGAKPAGNNPGMLLKNNFTAVFGPAVINGVNYTDVFQVGIGKTLYFTSAQAITNFLPQGGKAGVLTSSLLNPTQKTSAGVFAGQVTAMKLNVTFAAAKVLPWGLGDMVITRGAFAGKTVSSLLTTAERVLGGDTSALPAGVSISALSDACTAVNENFCETDNGFLIYP